MKYFLGFIFLLGFIFSAQAQEELSLERAIEIGLQNNFDVQIQKLEVEIAATNNNWGQAGRYPTVSLSANQNNAVTERKPANPFAVPGRSRSHSLNGQLDVQFILFDGFTINLTKQRLEQLERQGIGNATLRIESSLQAIILSYYTVLLEAERVTVRKKVMDFSRERYEYVKLRKELGGAITFDVLQEQNNYLTDSTNYLLQQLNYKNEVRNLNLLLNENISAVYQFSDSLRFQDEPYDLEDLRAKMSSSNTNLRNQYISQELQKTATQLALADRFPTITFNAGVNGSEDILNANFNSSTGPNVTNTVGFVGGDPNQPVTNTVPSRILVNQTNNGYSYGPYGNFGLRYTLFNGGQVNRAIENAKVRERIQEMTTGQLKQSLENSLLATLDVYNLRRQLVEIAQTKLQAAELNLSLANERYKNGALSAIDLRIVQESYQNSALENYQAIFNALSSKIELIRLTGGLVDQFNGE
jgi:outer membrane protein